MVFHYAVNYELQYRDWDKVDVDAIVADMDRQEDLEKEASARARLAKERATREADEAAASVRIEQAIALKEEGNLWLKQGDLQGALQKVHFVVLHGCDESNIFLLESYRLLVLGSNYAASKRCSFFLQQG